MIKKMKISKIAISFILMNNLVNKHGEELEFERKFFFFKWYTHHPFMLETKKSDQSFQF